MAWPKGVPRGPKAKMGGRQKGTLNKPTPPQLKLIAQECEVGEPPPAEAFDALEAMKALARQLMSRVTSPAGSRTPKTDHQRVLYEQRLSHLVPLLKEIATYQHRKKGPEPAPMDDGRDEFLEVLAVMVAKHVTSDSAKREIYEVIEAQVRGNVPRLVQAIRPGRPAGP